MKYITLLTFLIINFKLYCQYDIKYVENTQVTIENEKYSLIKINRSGNHVKMKYFASRGANGQSVYDRFLSWSNGKNIVLYSSGTYISECDKNLNAIPEGICIDEGNIVNKTVLTDKLDGLAIVYESGGLAVSNLKLGDLTIQKSPGLTKKINLLNSIDKFDFIDWAQQQKATVFQTHLFYYKNQNLLSYKSNTKPAQRRLLVVGKINGSIYHCIVYLSKENSILSATEKATKYLNNNEGMTDIIFALNLDTGCQNVFQFFNSKGIKDKRTEFSGDVSLIDATNLIVYYYE